MDNLDGSKMTSVFEAGKMSAPRLSFFDTCVAIDTSDEKAEEDGGYTVEVIREANAIAVPTATKGLPASDAK